MINKIKIFLVFVFVVGMFFPVFALANDMESQCGSIINNSDACSGLSSVDCKALLEKCSEYYSQQSAKLAGDITKTSTEKNTLQNAITKLKYTIQSLDSDINEGKVMVKGLNMQISDTQQSIQKTTSQIKSSQEQLIAILQSVYKEDKKPLFVILLEGNLSDFFNNLANLEKLNFQVKSILDDTKNLKKYLEEQQEKMSENVESLQKTIALQTVKKQQNEQNRAQQDQYLKLTEAQYQKQLKEKQEVDKNVAAIKARIYSLVGVSDVPTFGQAAEIAKSVSNTTGVRAALLLAVLTQESNLGKNVGQCYVTDFTTGDGTNLSGIAKKRVMSPKNIPGFIELTKSLGKEANKTPVSCWIPMYSSGVPYGWGGAMGPAQFISSTWAMYTNKVAQITGKTANPWNINDAFLASGLLLKDNGALTSESVAAAKYYCGGNYGRRECTNYANSVLALARKYEADLKTIGY